MPDMREDEIEGVVAGEQDEDLAARAEDEAVVAEAEQVGPVPCEFICGRAGSGKSYWCKAQIASDPAWGLLTASTGIAAVNLDAVTINSTLKYFDTDSLRENYLQGTLTRIIHDLALQYHRLCIDEISMTPAEQLDLIHRATAEANGYRDITHPMGLTLVGDFAQLPAIKARWAFEAKCWPQFAAHTTRLTKMWRQDQVEFLDALQAARMGDGTRAASILSSVGIQWHTSLDIAFDGTTIIPKNDAVDRFNWIALERAAGAPIAVSSRRWGRLRAEWKNIPERLQLKVGAYVMILANSYGDANENMRAMQEGIRASANMDSRSQELEGEMGKGADEEVKRSKVLQPQLRVSVGESALSQMENVHSITQPEGSSEKSERELSDPRGIQAGVPPESSLRLEDGPRVRAPLGDGGSSRPYASAARASTPQERSAGRQSTGESSTGYRGDSSGERRFPILRQELRNSISGGLSYANGDCGHVEGFDGTYFYIRLVRTGNVVSVPRLVRSVSNKDKPSGFSGSREEGYCARPHRDAKGRYVEGQVEFYPIRLAYGSTVHRSQGLSLDRVQIDMRQPFMHSAAMMYVSLSRCRSLEGLRLVGQPEVLARHCHCDPKVGPWL